MLDALYDLTTGAGGTAPGAPNPMERFGDAAIVGRALTDEVRSVDDLVATLDLPHRRIESALALLVRADAVAERDGRYHTTLEGRSLSDALRNAPMRITDRAGDLSARFMRPFRLFDR